MIRYSLRCANGHEFESWFAGAEAFETLAASDQIACPHCGITKVEKALMAPKVRSSKVPDLVAATTDREKALAKVREEVEKNSDYVGLEFATEARAMHDGEAPMRSIYGEAKPEDAKALIEDGVPVAPLPFTPRAKTN